METVANDNHKITDTSNLRILDTGDGLYLEIDPTGKKVWWLKLDFGGRDKLKSLGTYPEVSPEEAHRKKLKLLANHINPNKEKTR